MLINESTKRGCQKSFGRLAWSAFVFQCVLQIIAVFIVLRRQKQTSGDVNGLVGQDAA